MSARIANEHFTAPRHHHAACVRVAITKAEEYCRKEELRLTLLRRQGLLLVMQKYFNLQKQTVELAGLCNRCHKESK